MSGTLNKVMLIGRLGKKPELSYTPSGVAVANFPIATDQVWKDDSGTQQQKTEWHRIVVWRRLAEICGEYLDKGKLVYIEGRLQTRSWEDDQGNKRYTTEVVASNMQMLGSRSESGGGQAPPMPSDQDMPGTVSESASESASDNQAEEEDDLPF